VITLGGASISYWMDGRDMVLGEDYRPFKEKTGPAIVRPTLAEQERAYHEAAYEEPLEIQA
jgi:hypothetical protein